MCKHGHDLDESARLRTLPDGRIKRECRLCERARKAPGTRYHAAHPRSLRGTPAQSNPYVRAFRAAFPAYGALVYGVSGSAGK